MGSILALNFYTMPTDLPSPDPVVPEFTEGFREEALNFVQTCVEKAGLSLDDPRLRFKIANDHPIESPDLTREEVTRALVVGRGPKYFWYDKPGSGDTVQEAFIEDIKFVSALPVDLIQILITLFNYPDGESYGAEVFGLAHEGADPVAVETLRNRVHEALNGTSEAVPTFSPEFQTQALTLTQKLVARANLDGDLPVSVELSSHFGEDTLSEQEFKDAVVLGIDGRYLDYGDIDQNAFVADLKRVAAERGVDHIVVKVSLHDWPETGEQKVSAQVFGLRHPGGEVDGVARGFREELI